MVLLSEFEETVLVCSVVGQVLLVVIMLGVTVLDTAQPCIAVAIDIRLEWKKAFDKNPLADIKFATTF